SLISLFSLFLVLYTLSLHDALPIFSPYLLCRFATSMIAMAPSVRPGRPPADPPVGDGPGGSRHPPIDGCTTVPLGPVALPDPVSARPGRSVRRVPRYRGAKAGRPRRYRARPRGGAGRAGSPGRG